MFPVNPFHVFIFVLLLSIRKLTFGAVTKFRVMTFNVWNCGNRVTDGTVKIADEIMRSEADIVFLQEVQTSFCVTQIAGKLQGFAYCDVEVIGDLAIFYRLDRFIKIDHTPLGSASGLLNFLTFTHYKVCQVLDLNTDEKISLVNLHLSPLCYGPELVCGLDSGLLGPLEETKQGRILTCEVTHRNNRLREILDIIELHEQYSKKLVILAGDLNAPSSMDFNANTSDRHCGMSNMSWPVAETLNLRGFVDAYREVNPDPDKDPGITYSPVFSDETMYGDKHYPQARIDYIYYRQQHSRSAHLEPVFGTTFIRTPLAHAEKYGIVTPEVAKNFWPSDHAAVLVDFVLSE